MGKIALRGLEFFAYHGFYEEERKVGNRYEVSIEVEVDFTRAGEGDELDYTVNYEGLYSLVDEIMKVPTKLLETLACSIINQTKSKYPEVDQVSVEVIKHNPPIGGVCKQAVVSLTL